MMLLRLFPSWLFNITISVKFFPVFYPKNSFIPIFKFYYIDSKLSIHKLVYQVTNYISHYNLFIKLRFQVAIKSKSN